MIAFAFVVFVAFSAFASAPVAVVVEVAALALVVAKILMVVKVSALTAAFSALASAVAAVFERNLVEFERADVAFLVVIFLFNALLELAVFLEAVLVGHGAFLFFCLQDVSLASEVFQLAVKYLIFTEFALKRTVVERYLY